jgi:hypothetical protein
MFLKVIKDDASSWPQCSMGALASDPAAHRILFAAQPDPLSPLLQCIHRVVAAFLVKQSGL